MQFEQFEGPDMREALRAVKASLGPDAIILATRQLPRRGLWRRARVQVTAARAETAADSKEKETPAPRPVQSFAERYGNLVDDKPSLAAGSAPSDAALESRLGPLKEELREVRSRLAEISPHAVGHNDQESSGLESLTRQLEEEFGRMRRMLAAVSLGGTPLGVTAQHSDKALLQLADVDDAVAQGMLDELNRSGSQGITSEQAIARLRLSLAQAIPTLGDFFAQSRRRRVALVGPTGVGKTTTVAKIAAHAALKHHKRVALISLDTYRIGAAEQIGHYGRLVGVPVTTAHDRASFVAALEAYSTHDLVLIDTAGRGPNQAAAHCLQLRQFFSGHQVEVYVTLAAATRRLERQEMLHAMGELSSLGARALILTKLDEAVALGSCISLTHQTGLPLAFVTSGQRVPEDLALADATALAQRLIDRVLQQEENGLDKTSLPSRWGPSGFSRVPTSSMWPGTEVRL